MHFRTRSGLFARWVPLRTGSAALLIFIFVVAVYLINPDPYFSGDMNSNSVFAFNVLRFKSIYLDAFALSDLFKVYNGFSFTKLGPGFFGEGRWTLAYPAGTAIITFPLCVVFYIYFKLTGAP